MLICLDLHALYLIPCFPMLCASFCSRLMLGLHVYMLIRCCWLCLVWIYVFTCLFPCYMFRSLSSHACMLGFAFFHAFMLAFTCLDIHLHAYMHISMPICPDLCPYMPMCLDLYSLCALCHFPCACVLHVMFMCLDLGYVCHAMFYCSHFVPLLHFLVFWPNG